MTGRLRLVVDRALGWALVALMALMVVNVLWQVATRFILDDPSSYTEEVARYLLIWVGLLGAAYAAGRRSHLAIDLLPERLAGRRRHLLLLLIEACIFLFALLALVIGGSRLVSLTLLLGQSSAALGLPLGIVYLALPISGLLMMFFSVGHAAEELRELRGEARAER